MGITIFMGKSRSASFRRILLSRILLLIIPVLLVGEYMVYRKARSSVLTTARYNLMESANRKAEELATFTAMMRSQVLVSSQYLSEKATQPETAPTFVQQLKAWLPPQVQCVQLIAAQSSKVLGSTCGSKAIVPLAIQALKQNRPNSPLKPADVLISPSAAAPSQPKATSAPHNQLGLVFSTPIYDAERRLAYVLNVEARFWQELFGQDISRQGYTVVLTQDGIILAHPLADRIGSSITEPPNLPILEEVLKSAIAGEENSLHLFEENGAEWLAGYTAIKTPVVGKNQQTWAILAIAPISNALHEIRGIQQVLVLLTLGLLGASVLATLVIARDLAFPLEQLRDYALQIRHRANFSYAPKNFKIRELNQLAAALDHMIQQLNERAEELETAWQETQVANQLKSEFLAATSHELRTPLNGIIGSLRLIEDGFCDSPEEVSEFLQLALDSANHLLKLINDLLDISKIELGQTELSIQSVNIEFLCESCVQMVSVSAQAKRIDLSVHVASDITTCLLDERRVRQMLTNLLSNAVKFTGTDGYVRLSASLQYGSQLENENRPDRSPIDATTPYLCLEVADSGIGIDPKHWHLLFRPFQQIDSSSTRNYEGTGLGLALTKRFAELHGGTLSFNSTLGQGSTFRIWLPILQPME